MLCYLLLHWKRYIHTVSVVGVRYWLIEKSGAWQARHPVLFQVWIFVFFSSLLIISKQHATWFLNSRENTLMTGRSFTRRSTQAVKNNPQGTVFYGKHIMNVPILLWQLSHSYKENMLDSANWEVKLVVVIFWISFAFAVFQGALCYNILHTACNTWKPTIPENEFPSFFSIRNWLQPQLYKAAGTPLVGTLHLLKRKYDHNKEL